VSLLQADKVEETGIIYPLENRRIILLQEDEVQETGKDANTLRGGEKHG